MSCEPGEEARVTELARELDATIRALKSRVGEIGDRRMAVMAALTVLDRLRSAEEEIAELKTRAARLERAREAAILAAEADDEPLIARIEAATAAIDRLTANIHAQVKSAHAPPSGEPSATFAGPSGSSPRRSALPPEPPAPEADTKKGGQAGDPSFLTRPR